MHPIAILTRHARRFAVLSRGGSYRPRAYGVSMNSDLADCIEDDEISLNVDVPDETLERAVGIMDGRAVTWIYCTHVWYDCGWPQ